MKFFLLFCVIIAVSGVIVIDLRSIKDESVLFAVQAASGLENREGPNVYTVSTDDDLFWKQTLLSSLNRVDPYDFLSKSFSKWGAIFYSNQNEALIPSVATMAGIFSAIPINSDLHSRYPNTKIKYNTQKWKTILQAVEACTLYLNSTNGMAIESGSDLMKGQIVDWIVSRRLFTTYFKEGLNYFKFVKPNARSNVLCAFGNGLLLFNRNGGLLFKEF